MRKDVKVGNLKIAKFMGYTDYLENVYKFYGGPITGGIERIGNIVLTTKPDYYYSCEGMLCIRNSDDDYEIVYDDWYDNSMDCLLPVVEKIESMGYRVHIVEDYCKIFPKTNSSLPIHKVCCSSKIKSTWYACIEFIDALNNKKNNKMVIKIKATFKGQDGSCGYKTNETYNLYITHNQNENICIETDGRIHRGICEYQSMVTFLNNWDNITVCKQ
jgi:hypothetical protein